MLKLDDQEKKSLQRSLIERKARLSEIVGDTTLNSAERRLGSRELTLTRSILQRLRSLSIARPEFDAE